MNLITVFLHMTDGCIELISLIACADLLGILYKNQISKNRIGISVITYLGTSFFELFITASFGNSLELFAIIFYYLRLILTIFLLYGYINRKIIYLIAFLDLSVSLAKTSVSSILANMLNKNANDVSAFVMVFIQIAVLIIIL